MVVRREVVYEPPIQSYLDEQQQNDPLLVEVLRGLEWRISREPECGAIVRGWSPPRFMVSKTYRLPLPKTLKLMYRYTNTQVIIEFANVIDYADYEKE